MLYNHTTKGTIMDKYIFNDKVAVLYSPGFGAGWYTWNQEYPELIFSPAIVKLVAEEKFDELQTYIELKYPEIYKGGLMDLEIEWIPVGTEFRISEYDGAESIELKDEAGWFTA
jgi:hypothetical protein